MSPEDTAYKVQNWSDYNAALVRRGSLTVWMSPETVETWEYDGPTQQGAQPVYSDLAIKTCLQVKIAYSLPLRQTQGFVRSLFDLMGVDLPVPDSSTLSRWQGDLDIDLEAAAPCQKEPRHLVIDSTGLKVYGEGEWKQRTHGKQKRRTWRQLHLGVDADTGEIAAMTLTANSAHDSSQVKTLLAQIDGTDLQSVAADGAYDKWKVYEAIAEREATPVIPPQRGAKIKKHGNCAGPPLPRDEAIRYIRRHGRIKWKRRSGYHLRSLAETAVYRFKRLIGRFVEARRPSNEEVEVRLGAKVLNKMTRLGMPETVAVAL